MKNKDLNIDEIPGRGSDLRQKWLEVFANHLSKEEQAAIHMDEFLWHLCSYEKVACLEKEAAIEAFEKIEKSKCAIFYQSTDQAYFVHNAHNLKVEDLPYEKHDLHHCDMYVMDSDHQWTFIITHENGWLGPYFIERRITEFRGDRFTWRAGDIDPNTVQTNDPQLTKTVRENMRKASEGKKEKTYRR